MTDKELLERAAQAYRAVKTAQPIDRVWQAVDKKDGLVDSVRVYDVGEYDERKD